VATKPHNRFEADLRGISLDTSYQTNSSIAHTEYVSSSPTRQKRAKVISPLAKFFVDHRTSIFSQDDHERQVMRTIIRTVFPPELSALLIEGTVPIISTDQLRRFWKPDGVHVQPDNEAKLKEWMHTNGLDTGPGSITIFLHSSELETQRVKAARDLAVSTRQRTITDVPDSEVAKTEEQYKLEGASSVQRVQQADGRWTVSAQFPLK
jgi:hypothetical protein